MSIFTIKRKKTDYRPCYADGIKFRNEKVRDRYLFLKKLENQRVIRELFIQKRVTVIPKVYEGYTTEPVACKKPRVIQQASYYYADFTYVRDGKLVVEDVKNGDGSGKLTNSYLLKKKLMLLFHKIVVKEIYDATEWVNEDKKQR